jgi:electron transport complex protein RnfD
MQNEQYKFYVSFPPYLQKGKSVSTITHEYLIALIPALIGGVYYFRWDALEVMGIAVVTALVCEVGMEKFLRKDITAKDGHAVLIGLLLASLLSPSIPWWVVVIGSASGVIIGKQIFGGLGNNPFHPALIGWVMINLSWSDKFLDWIEPFGGQIPDPPLHVLKFDGLEAFMDYNYQLFDLLIGRQAGGIGTVCIVALLAGGVYLILKRMISWHIPVGVLGAVFIFSGIFWFVDKETYLHPLFHLASGSTVLAAFFIATDQVTSPLIRWNQLAYGIIIGALIVIIRIWGKYPDGVVFAILLANTITPLLNKIKPRPYGVVR